MDSDEYVYISIEGRRGSGFRETCSSQTKNMLKSGNVWSNPNGASPDGREELALRGARRLLSVIFSVPYSPSR